MSETLAAAITASILATQTNVSAFGSASFPLSLSQFLNASLSSGTGADKADQLYAAQYTLGAAESMTLNLNTMAVNGLAAPLDQLGQVIGVATIKMLALQAQGNKGCSYLSAVAAINAAGSGYTTNDVLTLVGGKYLGSVVIHSGGGGSGYVVGDVLTIAGGTGTAATVQVLTAPAGVIATLAVKTIGAYTVNPTVTSNAATGGTGTSASLDLTMLSGTAAQIKITAAAGAVTAIQTITVPGSYIALPPATACTVTGGTGTGATFNLTLTAISTPVFVESDYLTIGNVGTTAGWTSFLGGNTHTMLLKSGTTNLPGTILISEGGATGWVVGTGATNNILKITNSGSNPVTFYVVIVGATA